MGGSATAVPKPFRFVQISEIREPVTDGTAALPSAPGFLRSSTSLQCNFTQKSLKNHFSKFFWMPNC